MIRKTYVAAIALGLSMFGTGCGAVGAMTNPGVIWAVGEPAPMGVVVRRAEVAGATADQVDRLIAHTTLDEATKEAAKLSADEAKTLLASIGSEPVYVGTQGVRVVPAEAWLDKLAHVCATGEGKTAIQYLGDDVAAAYTKVSELGNEIAALEAKVKLEEHEADKEGADTAAIEKNIADLEKQIDDKEASFDPLVDDLVAKIKTASAGLSAEDKALLTPFVASLRGAVADALTANQAAFLRYGLAAPGMTDDVQSAAKRFAADSVEDQIGTRPDLTGLQPDVKLEGTDVKLTLNNVPAEKIGDIQVDQLVADTSSRTTTYFGRALTLLGYTEENSARLELQGKILDAWVEGLGASGALPQGISSLEVVAAPGAAKGEKAAGAKAKARTPGGLAVPECGEAAPAADEAAPEGESADAAGEGEGADAADEKADEKAEEKAPAKK
jgi:hypothetical protein